MISYKLAKQLKDAGWKQTGLMYTWFYEEREHGVDLQNTEGEYLQSDKYPNRILCPTLSELIDACGEGSFEMFSNYSQTSWIANFKKTIQDSVQGEAVLTNASGETKEEAVVKLWLKLHDKK